MATIGDLIGGSALTATIGSVMVLKIWRAGYIGSGASCRVVVLDSLIAWAPRGGSSRRTFL